MTPAGNRGAPLSAALALLAAITLSTAVWAGVAVPRTAAVVREAVAQEFRFGDLGRDLVRQRTIAAALDMLEASLK